MRLSRVLVDLDHSEGREAIKAHSSELVLVDAPSCRATWLANCGKSLMRVQVAVSGIKCNPIDQIVGSFKSPACHDEALLD